MISEREFIYLKLTKHDSSEYFIKDLLKYLINFKIRKFNCRICYFIYVYIISLFIYVPH